METTTSSVWIAVFLLSLIHQALSGSMYGGYLGDYEEIDGDVNSKSIKLSTSFPKTSNGQCQVEISVVGKGVKDKFKEPCADKTADSVSTDDVFIFGDPKINSLTLFSKEPSVLYVVKNKICTKKTYKEINGETKIIISPVVLANCKRINKAISDLLTNHRSKSLSSADVNSIQLSPAVTSSPADLQQFVPTYPFPLGDHGKDGFYSMTTLQLTDSYNVKGCYNYIKAKGKGINDHFQVPCFKGGETTFSTADFMSFGSPTSTLGLFSDTPSTLIIMTKGTCYKKTYGVTPTGPTLMGGEECEEVKRRMTEKVDSNLKLLDNMMSGTSNQKFEASTNGGGNYNNNNPPTCFVPLFGHTLFEPYPDGFPYETSGQLYDTLYPQPPITSDEPQPPATSSTELEVEWREGNYKRVCKANPSVIIKKNNKGLNDCTIKVTVIGRGLNDEITGSCSEMGRNIKKKTTSYSLAVADPSTRSGMFTEDWGSLVVINNGQCTLRKYDSSPITHTTKITSSPVDKVSCDKVKSKISGLLG